MGLDKDDIKQLIAILQKGLVDNESNDDDQEEIVEIVKNKKKKSSTTKKTKNLFETMAEYRMHKDDIAIDKKLRVQPPTERTRTYAPIKVKCRVCGKTELINPALIESSERYKCNKCSTSAG